MSYDWKKDYHRYHRYFVNLSVLYKNRKVVVYTGLTLTMLAIAFFSLFALKPTISTILSLVSDLKAKRIIEQKLQSKINSITTANAQLMIYSDLLPLIDEALPKEPAISEMIWYFENSVKKNNLEIKSLSYDPIVSIGEIKNVPGKIGEQPLQIGFSITGVGTFADIINFLTELENLRRIVVIDSISMSIGSLSTPNPGSVGINLNVGGKFYFKP